MTSTPKPNSSKHSFPTSNFLQSGAFICDSQHAWVFLGPFVEEETSDEALQKKFPCLIAPDFFNIEKRKFLYPAFNYEFSRADFLNILKNYKAQMPPPQAIVFPAPSLATYKQSFNTIKAEIKSKKISKAVVFATTEAKATWTPNETFAMLSNILEKANPKLWLYGYWNSGEGILGASPEMLFQLENPMLTTQAVAGTSAKGREDELQSEKNQFEHKLVIEDIQDQVKKWGELVIYPTKLMELPTISHLETKINVELKTQFTLLEGLKLHPTAAVGVFPRSRGYKWMEQLPGQQDRRRLGAPFVWMRSPQSIAGIVALRNVQWDSSGVLLGSGSGIVKDSTLENEWEELRLKRQSVLNFGVDFLSEQKE